jgi:hypothetical protein
MVVRAQQDRKHCPNLSKRGHRVVGITLLSCVLIPWVAHTWRGLTCVRTARIHRKKHDVCATQKDLTK